MLTFLGIATSSVGEYNATQARFRILAITSWCSMVAFFYLTLRVWMTADTFGSQPQCNDWTVYVLWGVSVPATTPWLRWLIVSLVCLAIIKFIVTTTRMVASLGLSTGRNGSTRSINTDSTGGPGLLDRLLPCSNRASRSPGLIARVFASIYSAVMLELTIRRNASSDEENVWSFGQIIALLITLMTVNEIIHFIFGENLGLNLGQRCESRSLRRSIWLIPFQSTLFFIGFGMGNQRASQWTRASITITRSTGLLLMATLPRSH